MVVVVRLMNLLGDRYFGGGKIVVDEFIKKIESLKGSAIVGCRQFNVEQKSSRSDRILIDEPMVCLCFGSRSLHDYCQAAKSGSSVCLESRADQIDKKSGRDQSPRAAARLYACLARMPPAL
jgi:hypothetical protein